MRSAIEDVALFHNRFDIPIRDKAILPSMQERKLRHMLLQEEFNEYLKAEREDNIVEIADALGDIIYVALGTALVYGIPMEEVFDAIHRSNMTKIKNPDGGKVMKPEGWKAPDIASILHGVPI